MYTVNETMVSIVKNFSESVGLINVWLLKPDDDDTRNSLLRKLDTLEKKLKKMFAIYPELHRRTIVYLLFIQFITHKIH